jgi:FKBP-type peptidyl-prolyl cis-trans isomerase FklB
MEVSALPTWTKGNRMKRGLTMAAGALGVLLLSGVTSLAADNKPELKTEKEKLSYSIGISIGTGLGMTIKRQGVDVDADLLAEGFKTALKGETPILSQEEVNTILANFKSKEMAKQKEMMAKQEAEQKKLAEKNLKEGTDFLAANAKKEGVKVLPSGLQYKIIKEGTGKTPTKESKVTVDYKGTLIDGTVFDSSYERGKPVAFKVDGVIPGWTEGLQLMKEGAKYQFFIPSKLAYGENGSGPIPPNAALIFDVELKKVE